jgi:hypothetical protein
VWWIPWKAYLTYLAAIHYAVVKYRYDNVRNETADMMDDVKNGDLREEVSEFRGEIIYNRQSYYMLKESLPMDCKVCRNRYYSLIN